MASQTSPVAARSEAKAKATRPRSIWTSVVHGAPRMFGPLKKISTGTMTLNQTVVATPSQRLPKTVGAPTEPRRARRTSTNSRQTTNPTRRSAITSNAGYMAVIVPSGSRP